MESAYNTATYPNNALLEKVETLKELATNTSQAIEDVQTAKLEVECQTQFLTDTITRDFQRLHQILGQTENDLYRVMLRSFLVKMEIIKDTANAGEVNDRERTENDSLSEKPSDTKVD